MQQSPTDEPARDVLAAELFGVPAPDPTIHHGPVRLPEDPTGIEEPHDVLAAEEFAMPAPRRVSVAVRAHDASAQRMALGAIVLAFALLALRRVSRRA